MINYVIVIAISTILALVSIAVFIFFVMIDKDEEAHYKKLGKDVPFEDIRGDEILGIFLVISVVICKTIAYFIGIKSKWVYFISAVTIVLVTSLGGILLEKLYYKIKYKRYPHLKPDSKSDNEDIDSFNNK